jgi:hypothetical protein
VRLRFLLLAGLGALALLVTLIGFRARAAMAAYADVIVDIDRLRAIDPLDPASLPRARDDFRELTDDVDRFGALLIVPVIGGVVDDLPWVGPRYSAALNLVAIAHLAGDSGVLLADALVATDPSSPGAWVQSLASHTAELQTVAANVHEITLLRGRIDPGVLPDNVRRRLDQLDALLDRPELRAVATLDIPSVFNALGSTRPVRFLILFQNPAELRPTGGFPGTVALLTVDRGNLNSTQFFDVHELTRAYLSQRSTPLPQPWPIERFFPQSEFMLHDAAWWADFPRSAQQIMAMYAQSGWPPIDGVVAVQPEVASDLVSLTGPLTIEFEGQTRTITSDNVYEEINRQRRSHLESVEDGLIHKQMLGLIGQTLIERLKSAGRARVLEAAKALAAACQRRDLQAYAQDPAVEAELDRQSCTGRLLPPGDAEPTLAVTYANLALSKTSLDMRPRLSLVLGRPHEGMRDGVLDIDVRDGAVADEDPIYAGFQRWWVSVALPTGSTLLSDPGPMEDPEAPNGGSYMAAIFPDMTGRITVRFVMPDAPTILVRRQPGVRAGDLEVTLAECAVPFRGELEHDLVVDLATLCG